MNKLKFIVIILATVNTVFGQSIDFKIMSFNVQQPYGNNWEARRDSAVKIITTQNPDIIGTQEAINSQRKYLIDSTKQYSWYGLGRDGGDKGEGSWIFYKPEKYNIDSSKSGNFWLSNTPDIPSRFGGDYNRICTYVYLSDIATGKSFYVFNAHFPTPDLSSARLSSMQLIAKRLAEISLQNEPFILTGDFNSPESDKVTKWMKVGIDNPIHCRDSYRDVYPTGFVTTGFGTKFDYIYYENNNAYITHDSWVVKTPSGASDHMPIVASISIPFSNETNYIPTAMAGRDSTIFDLTQNGYVYFTLDASQSFDPDGNIQKYEWKAVDTLLGNGIKTEVKLPIGAHAIYLTVTDNQGETNTDQVLILIKPLVSNQGLLLNEEITPFPNPVDQTLFYKSNSDSPLWINIYNERSEIVLQTKDLNPLNVSSLKSGLYLVVINQNGKVSTHKILKQ